jgi:Na+/alanine symporter
MIWTVVDIATGIWVVPNVIALIFLTKQFLKLFNDFEDNIMPLESKEIVK